VKQASGGGRGGTVSLSKDASRPTIICWAASWPSKSRVKTAHWKLTWNRFWPLPTPEEPNLTSVKSFFIPLCLTLKLSHQHSFHKVLTSGSGQPSGIVN
jgi:hypothetical protein